MKNKQTLGRRRVQIKLIEDKNAREVTFSKRHRGLFRKGSELSLLCGVDVAVVVFSPHGNPFTFGNPSADAVINRYVMGGVPPSDETDEHWIGTFDEDRRQCEDLIVKLEAEKQREKRIAVEAAENRSRVWNGGNRWDEFHALSDNMEKEDLEYFGAKLEKLYHEQ